MRDPSTIKELFRRFLEGRCTPEETALLVSYLENSGDENLLPSVEEFREAFPDLSTMDADASERVFRKLSAVIERDGRIKGLSPAHSESREDVDRRLLPESGLPPQRKARRLPAEAQRQIPGESGRKSRLWLRAAAAIAVIAVLSVGLYLTYMTRGWEKYDTGNAEITTVELDDGTLVTLNANSELKVKLQDAVREVWLDGEAFFRVAHEGDRKFIVHTSGRFSVEVLGTEFNVKDRPEGTSVVLNKGSVKVRLRRPDAPPEELMIEPGEMVVHRTGGSALSKSRVDTVQYSSWKDNLLLFDETPLALVARTIENQFGYKVQFAQDSLAGLRFTGSNPASDLDMLLETLERSFSLSIQKSGGEIRIGSLKNPHTPKQSDHER